MTELKQFYLDQTNTDTSTLKQVGANSIVSTGNVQSKNYVDGKAGYALKENGDADFQKIRVRDITLANRAIGVSTADELINSFTTLSGGGTINLAAGTYILTSSVAIPSSIKLIGDNASTTTIIFTGTANFTLTGNSVYTTGTVSINQGSTALTGSGTTFTSAMVGRQIFLSNRWYVISAFGSTTSLTLATAYADSNLSASTYRIADVIKDVEFEELTLIGASGTKVIDGIDVRDIQFNDVTIVASGSNGKPIEFDNAMSIDSDRLTLVGTPGVTSHGIHITNGSFINLRQTAAVSNGGSGVVWDTVKTSSITFSAANANSGDGYNFTNVDNSFFIIEMQGNGGQGMELVSGCDSNRIIPNATGNTSDGIKLSATSDTNLIIGGAIIGNGGYGVNIAASSCDNTNVTANVFSGNSSGAVNDAGTSTIIRGNIGINDNSTSAPVEIVKSYTAGENLALGDAVFLEDSGTTDLVQVTTSTDSTNLYNIGENSGSEAAGQSVQESTILNVTGAKILLRKVGSPVDNIVCAIQGDSSNSPNGVDLTTGSVSGSSLSTSYGTITFTFSPAVNLTASTKYWIVLRRSGSNDSSNYYQVGGTSGVSGAYANGVAAVKSGGTWSTQVTDLNTQLINTTVQGSIYKTSALTSGQYEHFIGFIKTAASKGESAQVIIVGEATLSGLSAGNRYYLSDTRGAIATSAGTNIRKVAIATSSTTALITNIW